MGLWTLWRRDDLLPLPGIEPKLLSPSVHSLVTILAEFLLPLSVNPRTRVAFCLCAATTTALRVLFTVVLFSINVV